MILARVNYFRRKTPPSLLPLHQPNPSITRRIMQPPEHHTIHVTHSFLLSSSSSSSSPSSRKGNRTPHFICPKLCKLSKKKKKKNMQNMKLLLNYLYWKRKRFIEIRGTPWSHSLASPPVVVILKSGPRIYITYIHFLAPFPLLPSPFPFPAACVERGEGRGGGGGGRGGRGRGRCLMTSANNDFHT